MATKIIALWAGSEYRISDYITNTGLVKPRWVTKPVFVEH